MTVVRFLELRRPPPGVPELREGEKPVIPEPGLTSGGDGMRPVGWTRWKPVPPKGSVTWRGRVTDVDGRPVEGAVVYRVELDEQGTRASPASFQWVAQVARTQADGTFESASQPDGSFLAAANWRSRMNRPRGLDLTGAVPVRGAGTDVVSGIDLRLPIAAGRMGGLRFTVTDEDGAPLPAVQVTSGFERGWTDAKGRFELGGLDPGEAEVSFEFTGFAPKHEVMTVREGAVRDVEVRMELAAKGSLEVAGRVADEEGKPVAGIRLFLTDGTREGGRWATAGADGRYRFAKLPDAWAKKTVDVMITPNPDRDLVLGDSKRGVKLPEPALDFTVRRLVPLRIVVVSAADGKPIAHFNLDVRLERPGEEPRTYRSMSCYEEDGEISMSVPRTRLRIQVEGKGHRSMEVAADASAADANAEVRIEMTPE